MKLKVFVLQLHSCMSVTAEMWSESGYIEKLCVRMEVRQLTTNSLKTEALDR